MQMFVLVLNRTEYLDKLLSRMSESGIAGATVLDSRGMARILCDEDTPMFGTLRSMLNPERRTSKTVFVVLEDGQIEMARKLVNEVTGGLTAPDTGIMFSTPVLFAEGLVKQK